MMGLLSRAIALSRVPVRGSRALSPTLLRALLFPSTSSELTSPSFGTGFELISPTEFSEL